MGVIHTAPGAEAQVDYGQGPLVKDSDGVYRRTRLFAMTLGWSRKAVWLLSLSSSATVWSTLHEKAFRQLGGTPKVIVLDNLKKGVKDVDYCDTTINLEYAQVLRHYDVEPCQRSVVLQMLPAEHQRRRDAVPPCDRRHAGPGRCRLVEEARLLLSREPATLSWSGRVEGLDGDWLRVRHRSVLCLR